MLQGTGRGPVCREAPGDKPSETTFLLPQMSPHLAISVSGHSPATLSFYPVRLSKPVYLHKGSMKGGNEQAR